MAIIGNLVRFAARHFGGGALDGAADGVVRWFTDHSGKMVAAVRKANDRSWRALEMALDDGVLSRLAHLPFTSADERAVRDGLQVILEGSAFTSAEPELRKQCLAELKAARNAGLLAADRLEPGDIESSVRGLDRLGAPSSLVDNAWDEMAAVTQALANARYANLARLLGMRIGSELPILVAAFAYFLRREVEGDAELARGLTFDQLRRIEGDLQSVLKRARASVVQAPDVLRLQVVDGVAMEFVLVPAGEFLVGSPGGEHGRCADEGPQQLVRLARPFYLARVPVTRAQWAAVMAAPIGKLASDARAPAHGVSHVDCMQFCERLAQHIGRGVRLPTEAEWEYACRAGSVTSYCYGDAAEHLGEFGWFNQNASAPQPVGAKRGNDWGLCDMHGNVWEWCADSWFDNYKEVPHDGSARVSADEERCVLRGGSFGNGAFGCRSASRGRSPRHLRQGVFGCRVVIAKVAGK